MEINPIASRSIAGAVPTLAPQTTTGSAQKMADSFAQVLDGLDQSQQNADTLSQKLSLGDSSVDLDQVMIGLEENDVNFRVVLAIRDRLVDAYHEVMRMSV